MSCSYLALEWCMVSLTFSRSSSTLSANLVLMCFTTNFLAWMVTPMSTMSQQWLLRDMHHDHGNGPNLMSWTLPKSHQEVLSAKLVSPLAVVVLDNLRLNPLIYPGLHLSMKKGGILRGQPMIKECTREMYTRDVYTRCTHIGIPCYSQPCAGTWLPEGLPGRCGARGSHRQS